MADNHFPTLVSKTADANGVTNPLEVRLSDGTSSISPLTDAELRATPVPISGTVTANAGTGPFPVSDNGGSLTVDAVDLDIRDLNSATDSVAVTDGGGSITVDGSVSVSNFPAVQPVNDNGGSLTVDGTVTVTATDLDIRNLNLTDDAVKISANTTANSSGNPIFVQVVSSGTITGEVQDYNTASAVAGGATSNHNYTAVNTFLLKEISISSSGASKVELILDPAGTPASKFVGFIPKQGGTLVKRFDPAIEVATGIVTRLVRTNREGSAQDLYSTIEGIDA